MKHSHSSREHWYPRFKQLLCKEWRELFIQFNAYVVIAVFLSIIAYTFTTVLFFQRDVSVVHAISQAANLLLLLIPLLTMRQFSKERDSGALSLLLSAGCREAEIFTAKLLVLIALNTIMILLCFSFPLALAVLGRPDFGVVFSGFGGLWLMAVSLIAIGLCVACFVFNPLIAALVSFAVFIGLWTVDIASYLLPPVLQGWAERLSFDLHLSRFMSGAIYLSDLSYFLLLAAGASLLGVARLSQR